MACHTVLRHNNHGGDNDLKASGVFIYNKNKHRNRVVVEVTMEETFLKKQ